jgi:hypothetical protein
LSLAQLKVMSAIENCRTAAFAIGRMLGQHTGEGAVMDPVTIAASLTALLAPYLQKAAEEFAGGVGKGAATFVQQKAGAIWHRLRSAFAGDAPAAEVLDKFEADPAAHKDTIEVQFAAKLKQDEPLMRELAAAIAEIKQAAPTIRVVQKMEEAESVVGVKAKRMKQGNLDVDQQITGGKSITGVELDEIG